VQDPAAGSLDLRVRVSNYPTRGRNYCRQAREGRPVRPGRHPLVPLLDFLLSAASGILLVFSFPIFGHPAVAWVALAPLLVALGGASLSRATALGLVTGLVYFTGTLYWITRVMAVYGALQPFVAVLVNSLLIAYLALFPALFAVATRRLVLSYGPRALLAALLVW
jgi:apolipoprotein N-acyltransferase